MIKQKELKRLYKLNKPLALQVAKVLKCKIKAAEGEKEPPKEEVAPKEEVEEVEEEQPSKEPQMRKIYMRYSGDKITFEFPDTMNPEIWLKKINKALRLRKYETDVDTNTLHIFFRE